MRQNSHTLKHKNSTEFYGPIDRWYDNEDVYDKLAILFESAINSLIKRDNVLFASKCSERTICGALMLQLDRKIRFTPFSSYYSDVEYNRNVNGKVKTINGNLKTIFIDELTPVKINCDLILHSRGKKLPQDNLIAIEMKKANRSDMDKDKDRMRLMALTRNSYDDVWSADGKVLPEHVCRYILGVYIEIDKSFSKLHFEYYRKGLQVKEFTKDIYYSNARLTR
jgi:hypothetical protein